MISAWAVGSESVRFRFQPRPTTRPSHTTAAPIGTSPASKARRAAPSASSIKSSSVGKAEVGDLLISDLLNNDLLIQSAIYKPNDGEPSTVDGRRAQGRRELSPVFSNMEARAGKSGRTRWFTNTYFPSFSPKR